MPRDEELLFADHIGRYYARQHGFPPMAGRLLGYLMICDPPVPVTSRSKSQAVPAGKTTSKSAADAGTGAATDIPAAATAASAH